MEQNNRGHVGDRTKRTAVFKEIDTSTRLMLLSGR